MIRIIIVGCLCLLSSLAGAQSNDWESPQRVSEHALLPHAHFIPYPSQAAAMQEQASLFTLSLDGTWQFHLAKNPEERPKDFFKTTFDVSKWKTIPVPANWQTQGYASYIFTDVEYPFPPNPPYVPKADNPVGSYRRSFHLPANWQGKQVLIHLGAVNSFFYLWINDHYVGFSKDSKTPAEFDISPYLRKGANNVSVQVFRFSDGSYLEGQDMWKLSGIERSVYLVARPQLCIYDFFVKAGLTNHYEDGTLDLELALNKIPALADKGKKIQIQLLDGELENKPVLQQESSLTTDSIYRFHANIPQVKTWNAEHPHLYTLLISYKDNKGNTLESIAHKIGFRTVEIKHGLFQVNGMAIKLKGVNRHEHDMNTAKVVNREGMLHDIRVMKQFNINAVRTSHYPNREEWYALCDQYGIYVVDEANIECDGMDMHPLKTLSDKPEWKNAYLDRTRRMVERDKNYCSIITWSLGNESRFGDNFKATYQYIKARDNSRPVQYEEASNTPYSDIYCPMYKPLPVMLEYVRDHRSKPFIFCEYAHMMGNSGGNFKDDWDLMYKHPQLQGGFIWDFSDQTFRKQDSLGRNIWAYGGDMGTVGATSDTSFCADGMLSADRSPHPQAFEVKKVYQPVHFEPIDFSAQTIRITNRYDFSNLETLTFRWSIKADGKVLASGRLPVVKIGAQQSAIVQIPVPAIVPTPGTLYFLHLEAVTNQAAGLLPKGWTVATEQFQWPVSAPVVKKQYQGDTLQVVKTDTSWIIQNKLFSADFNLQHGWLQHYRYAQTAFMQAPLQPFFWRAPTDNDIGNSMQLRCAMWQHAGDSTQLLSCKVTRVDARQVRVITQHFLPLVKAYFNTEYIVAANGDIQVKVHFEAGDTTLPEMPRMGMRMLVNKDFNQASWLGRGPFDNYQDRKYAADVDVYSMPADSLFYPYPRAQESGYRSDIHWMALHNAANAGWMACTDSLFNAGVLHFNMNKLNFNRQENNHGGSITNDPFIWWNIDYQQTGLGGDNSWGAKPHSEYMLVYKDYSYSFMLRPLQAGDTLTEKAKERFE